MAWREKIAGERTIGSYSCGLPGPLILAVSGIHGNEPSGARAIKTFLSLLNTQMPQISGAVLGIVGNVQASTENRRYLDKDLNRCFLPDLMAGGAPALLGAEARELKELVHLLHQLQTEYEDVCFIDCHTTAAQTIPYLSSNSHPDSLQLANRFPLNNVIGLQQTIPGGFSEYCNTLNFRGFRVEAGQHLSASAFSNQVAMLWLMLVYAGALRRKQLTSFQHYEQMLALDTPHHKQIYRLISHYPLQDDEEFRMNQGFRNFDYVQKSALLATNRHGDIVAATDGYLLMPLDQEKADNGFCLLAEENASY